MIFKAQQDLLAKLAEAQKGPMTDTTTTAPVATAPAPAITITAPAPAVAPATPAPVTEASATAATIVALTPPDSVAVLGSATTSDGLDAAVKNDAGKPRWELLPSDATEEMLKVLDFGAKKYGDWNWAGGMKWSRIFSATLRHMWSFQRGQDNDPESGLSHLAHAACNVLFLLSYSMWKRGQDDRPAAMGAGK